MVQKLLEADGKGLQQVPSTGVLDHTRPKRRSRYRPIADVNLILRRNTRILLGQRQNTGFGDGAFNPPAGHLEQGESVVEALIREAREEIGVVIQPADVRFAHVVHNAYGPGRVAFFFEVARWTGEVTNMEPEKCGELRWFPLDELPHPMVDYIREAIEHYAAGQAFSMFGWDSAEEQQS